MSKQTTQRPPQVTFAAGLVMAGSVLVVLESFAGVSQLRTLAGRELLAKMIEEPPLRQFGLSLEQGMTLSYWSLVVGAVCAAACVVLGWFAMQRSTHARGALSVFAVVLFVSGMLHAGFLTALVAAAVTFLWLSPGREWFRDGHWTPPSAAPAHGAPQGSPYARPAGQPYQIGSTAPAQPGAPAPVGPASAHDRRPVSRPQQAMTALWLTVVGGVCATAAYVQQALVTDAAELIEQSRQLAPPQLESYFDDYTVEMAQASLWVSAAMIGLWALAAMVLALLVVRRQAWARILLVISAAFVAPFCLLAGFGGDVLLLVTGISATATIVLLRARPLTQWLRG